MNEKFCGSVLWDFNETINTTGPDLTVCFRDTLLIWIPCGWIFLLTPFYLIFLENIRRFTHTWLNITKTVLSCSLMLLSVADIIFRTHSYVISEASYPAHVLAPFLTLLAMSLSVVLIQFGRMRGVRTTGVLFIYWLLQLISAILILQSKIRGMMSQEEGPVLYHLIFIIIFTLLVFLQLILAGFCVDYSKNILEFPTDKRIECPECPENAACFVSIITFWWFTGMVVQGYRKSLTRANLWLLNPQDTSAEIVPLFDKNWTKELNKSQRSKKSSQEKKDVEDPSTNILLQPLNSKESEVKTTVEEPSKKKKKNEYSPKLWLALARAFGGTFIFGSFMKLIYDILTFVSPLLLQQMIRFVRDKNQPTWCGYMYAALMFVNAFLQSMILHQYFHRCLIVGMRVRMALVSAVYKKSLRLSNAARKKSTVGEIVNLMAVDAQRFMELTTYLNMLWSAPFQMCLCLYYLWMILGPSVLAGVGVMVLMIPINAVIAKTSRSLQVVQMKLKDQRIKLMSEVLNGIKVLKLYAWEPSFQQKVQEIRQKELGVLRKAAYLNAVSSFTWSCSPFLVAVTTFAVYVLSSPDNILDSEKAFVSLSLFNILRFPLAMLPMLIANMVQASVSVKRLNNFLTNEDIDTSNVVHDANADFSVEIVDGSFSWEKTDEKPVLDDIKLQVKEGSLIGVVGHVGCGKSSLLSAILGETEKLQGKVTVKGSIAYVAQQAWIQNATLENNILFGSAKNADIYEKVIDACALRPDLNILPDKDQTEIGEKGINLSGGQKQRISLARAVYSDADIYLLDDPLSAVDSHVGKHIFEQVLSKDGLLKNKTRVLVTHGIGYLSQLDEIVVIVDGRISEYGTYQELLKQNGAFAEFLRNYLEKDDEGDEAFINDEEIQLREELLSQLGSSSNLALSIEKLHRLRRDTSRSAESGGTSPAIRSDVYRRPLKSQFSANEDNQASPRCISPDDAKVLLVNGEAGSSKPNSPTRKFLNSRSLSKDSRVSPKGKESEQLVGKTSEAKRLIQDERVETGNVKLTIYLAYMKSIGIIISVVIVLLYLGSNCLSIYSNFWLSDWSNDKVGNGTDNTQLRDLRLGVYAALGLSQSLLIFVAAFVLAEGALRASLNLHNNLLERGLRSPMSFFDSTPIGRILNRFSKDIDVIDTGIPHSLDTWTKCTLAVFGTLFVISFSTPWFLIVILPVGALYYLVQRFYVATSRQLRRLESVSRSPIYSHFGETVQGATTVRAYGCQRRFIESSEMRVDENQACYYPQIASNRWLAVRLELVGSTIVLFAALFAVIGRDHLTGGLVGLSISYALSITQMLNWMVRMSSELETNIVAVERVMEYTETETEADWINEDNRPPPEWPECGKVEFQEYSTSYRKELDPVLKGISCKIQGGEKIGIVGRTGAGKSSLTLALFRILESSGGSITIDKVNISEIGLHDLRSKLTIIPQDPVLFSGTLRMNLDPFDKYTDEEIWHALEHAHLKTYVSSLAQGLQHECSEGGENLSMGERQLICLARALLRKTRVLILDEATAAVDLETDDLIQSTIRTQFKECTVLTIAHRLNTIMDYTRIMVLENGKMMEFDAPNMLIANKDSRFYSMAKDAGLTE